MHELQDIMLHVSVTINQSELSVQSVLSFLQLQLTVEDGRVPLKTDTVQVTINVARDLALPIFFNDPYIFITDEERPINHTIGTVSAVDQDIRVRKIALFTKYT